MNKNEIDIQLIEACVLEKWNPIALGCRPNGGEGETCPLCQFYCGSWCCDNWCCDNCPIRAQSGERLCHNTPFYAFISTHQGSALEFDAIEAEIEFLISLLPETHLWRLNND